MKGLWLILPLAAACAPRSMPPPSSPAPTIRWIHAEVDAACLDFAAGDAAVAPRERVLVLLPAPAPRGGRRAPPAIRAPERVGVGEIIRIEIRVPRAGEDEVRKFRVLCGRPGLRLLDGDLVVTVGRKGTERRAVADSAGPVTFDLEEVGD
jgi:hypothetical protein